jgi:hypothetical protein
MHYAKKKPYRTSFLVDFSWAAKLTSSISSVHGLIASALGCRLVIWNIFTGIIHRILDFKGSIVSGAFNEELGILAATASREHFVSVNGKILAEIGLMEKVTVIVLLTVNSPRRPHAAIVGTSSGSLFVLELKFGRGIVDLKRLPSQHKHPIEKIIVHPTMRAFISVDTEKTSFMWMGPNVGGEVVPGGVFTQCHPCDAEASYTCPFRGRSVCGQRLVPQPDSGCPFVSRSHGCDRVHFM